ncbi:hypothetical protein E2C01_029829 [Portunus trituberculatus]|uniref:Uncharacterized protein n=1 Tax=Portunus trituberculatus TaxID=210409 RepID=A0A5B7EVM0_PORTR|nr:hypothetical protein [Portunus trituberculatus]
MVRFAAKFEFKSPSVHSVVRGHPTAKSEFRKAEIRQVRGLTVICRTAVRTWRRCNVFWSPGILGQIWISTTLLLIVSTIPLDA